MGHGSPVVADCGHGSIIVEHPSSEVRFADAPVGTAMVSHVASEKTKVIEWIFFHDKYDPSSGQVADTVVTFEDIVKGIDATGAQLSKANPANFWKDLTRNQKTRDSTWPTSVFQAGYTGSDAIGSAERASFRFVPVPTGQTTPFASEELKFDPQIVTEHPLQSLSIPQAMKALGRRDENWLAQVAVRLNLIETFFAVFSPRTTIEASFLQTGLKLGQAEVDAAYSVLCDDGLWLVSAEAKGRNEPLHLPQIARAASSLRRSSNEIGSVAGVIPFGMKIVGDSEIWAVEFAPVSSSDEIPTPVAQGLFKLQPGVKGIS